MHCWCRAIRYEVVFRLYSSANISINHETVISSNTLIYGLGVYSALKLKKLGYTDVTIFEKSDRVGGKSYNVDVKGEAYPQGSIFVEPSYFDNIVPLARIGCLSLFHSVFEWLKVNLYVVLFMYLKD